MPQIPRLLSGKSALAVVDMQQQLLPAMFEQARVTQNVLRLIRGAAIMHMPIIASEQYPKGLGTVVPEVAGAIPGFRPIEKMQFSAAAGSTFMKALRSKDVQSVLICGIEAHICVTQTCLDLIENGVQVFIAHDATSSRTAENWHISAERMRQAGAVIVSTEMALFELIHSADSPDFKKILDLVK